MNVDDEMTFRDLFQSELVHQQLFRYYIVYKMYVTYK